MTDPMGANDNKGGKKKNKVLWLILLILFLPIASYIGGSIGKWAVNNTLQGSGLKNNTNISVGNDKTNLSNSKADSAMTDTENKIIYLNIPDSFQKVENDTCIEYYEYATDPDAAYISLAENVSDYSQSMLTLSLMAITSEEFGTTIQSTMEDSLEKLEMEGVSVNTEVLSFSKDDVCGCTALTGEVKVTLSYGSMDTVIYTSELIYVTDKMYIWTFSDYSGGMFRSLFSDIMESAYLADYQG